MAEKERIYVGKARRKEGRYGEFFGIWITPEGVDDITRNTNAQGSINLVLSEMREPDRAGFTHTLYVDDYVPQGGGNGGHASGRDTRGNAQQGRQRAGNAQNSNRRNDGGFGDSQNSRSANRQPPPPPPADYDPEEDIPF